jgi:putative endonuclease
LDGLLHLHRRQSPQRRHLHRLDRRRHHRIWQHKTKAIPGFTATHGCGTLVWYEVHDTRESAFIRERRMKEWRRSWKLLMIEEANPTWADLYETLNQ